MMDQLLQLLFKVLAPIAALLVAAIVAWVIKRAVRAGIESRHGGSGGPIWFLAATLLAEDLAFVGVNAVTMEDAKVVMGATVIVRRLGSKTVNVTVAPGRNVPSASSRSKSSSSGSSRRVNRSTLGRPILPWRARP